MVGDAGRPSGVRVWWSRLPSRPAQRCPARFEDSHPDVLKEKPSWRIRGPRSRLKECTAIRYWVPSTIGLDVKEVGRRRQRAASASSCRINAMMAGRPRRPLSWPAQRHQSAGIPPFPSFVNTKITLWRDTDSVGRVHKVWLAVGRRWRV